VTVVSPELTEALTAWAIEGSIIHRPHRYRPDDLDGQQLVFSASDQREVTEAVSAEARRRGLWVNAADDPAFCDFLLPSVLRRGRLVVAVSTGGASPALAARVRRDLEAYFAPAYGELVELAAEVRAELRSRAHRPGGVAWREAFDGELIELLAEGRRAEAKARLLDRLGAAV
jgi:siroheme synthase-like protein